MKSARVLIPTGFGVNCEAETAQAFRLAGAGEVEQVHLTDLFAKRHARRLPDYNVLVFIGGFSYGDHIAGGFVQATRVRAHLQEDLEAFLANGGRVIGICNGFQTLVRLGLLPGPDAGPPDFVPRAALANNERLGYRNAWVRVAAETTSPCVWTRGLSTLEMPARHGEGRFFAEDDTALARLESRGQVALRYIDPDGQPTEEWPWNPNGSKRAVAGVCDITGRILGVMPHPEAFIEPWQHPDWRHRMAELEARGADGLALFRAGLRP